MKLISFYLPQYHPIPENDNWWGRGFTEWTNVSQGKPLFRGHYQPHVPADLSYYDLRLPESRKAQAELAASYGLGGFCYYHYWFNGKLLLEKPFDAVLESKEPDLPFCLCWANENWTRRWDGQENEVLIKQDYEEYDPTHHIDWLCRAFADSRYIKIKSKPLLLVYHAEAIPHLEAVLTRWRERCVENGFNGLYICSVKSFRNNLSNEASINKGFDAVVDFHPNFKDYPKNRLVNFFTNKIPQFLNRILRSFPFLELNECFNPVRILNYNSIVSSIMNRPASKVKMFPCVMPAWDNTARRKRGGVIIQNDDADIFADWLKNSIESVSNYEVDERIVFINAWNEWGEGCHLEPDLRNGHKFLKVIKSIMSHSACRKD